MAGVMEVVEPTVRMLANSTFFPCDSTAPRDPTDFFSLWHPYILMYMGHCVNATVFALLSLYAPVVTAVIMAASGLIFLTSAIWSIPIWGNEPGSFLWIGFFLKWLIVNLAATVPVLLMRKYNFSYKCVKISGICIYIILGSNVIWTMFMDSEKMFIVYVNRVAGGMLTIALILHCAAVCKAGLGLFEVRGEVGSQMPYGFGTSHAWILCYTVWNFLFAARIGLGTTLQDFLFWALMAFYKHIDGHELPIELYFGFARPVQLGSYIAFSEFLGAFVPYFYEATSLTEEQPLPIYSNSFILFVAVLNMIFSVFIVGWSAQRLICGLGYFQTRFEEVHKLEDTGSKRNLVSDEESEWEYEEEEEAEE